jgi:hypothetical protein
MSGRVDPYAIFQLNFNALGGEKNVKYDNNFHYKGELKIGDASFEIEEYKRIPHKYLRKISSNFKLVFKNGDDGINIWQWQDGRVESFNDANSPEREVQKQWDEYGFTDPKNRLFSVSANRKISVDGATCFEIKIKNNKTDEVVTQYYDTESYMLKREIKTNGNYSSQTDFSDYRSVGNTIMAFRKDYYNISTGERQTTIYDKIEKNVYISESLFFVPEDKSKDNSIGSLLPKGNNVDAYA